MAAKILGTKGPILRREERDFTPGQGWRTTRTWEAFTKAAAYSVVPELQSKGWRINITPAEGVKYIITGVKQGPEDGNEESPTNKWGYRKELVQKSIFNLPVVVAEVQKWTKAGNSVTEYKRACEEAANEGKRLFEVNKQFDAVGAYPIAEEVVQELSIGTTDFETDTIYLYRDRMASPGYPNKLKVGTTRTVYTSEELFAENGPAFDCPPEIVAAMPGFSGNPFPAAPDDRHKWGWRPREDEGEHEGLDKFTERTAWVLAAWSKFLYTSAV